MNVFEVTQKVKDIVPCIVKQHDGYYKFGGNDRLINEIIDIVNESGTARSCVGALARFTKGNGLQDATLAVAMANPTQSNNAAVSEMALNVGYSQCCSYRVLFHNDGTPARYYPCPTQHLRRKGKKTFVYNPQFGLHGFRSNENRFLSAYDPAEQPQARTNRVNLQIQNYGEQLGDIVYHFNKSVGPNYDIYPVPDYYSGSADIESDAGVSILERRNIKRGWKTSMVVSTGPMDRENQDKNGESQYDKFVKTIRKFAEEDAAVAVHLEGATNEAKPTVTTLDIANVLDATDRATDRVGRKVCRHFNVPPVLVGFATPGQLGNVQELKNMMDLFRLTVVERQQLIKEALTIAFPNFDWTLTTLNLWNETIKV
jgi:hypothetical protein